MHQAIPGSWTPGSITTDCREWGVPGGMDRPSPVRHGTERAAWVTDGDWRRGLDAGACQGYFEAGDGPLKLGGAKDSGEKRKQN